MIKLLNCPECKFPSGLRCYARTSVGVEVDKDGVIYPNDETSEVEIDKNGVFCSNCGIDLKIEEKDKKFRLAKVPDEVFVPKPKMMKRVLSALTGESRATLTT